MSPDWLHGVFSGIGKTAFLEGRLKHIHEADQGSSTPGNIRQNPVSLFDAAPYIEPDLEALLC